MRAMYPSALVAIWTMTFRWFITSTSSSFAEGSASSHCAPSNAQMSSERPSHEPRSSAPSRWSAARSSGSDVHDEARRLALVLTRDLPTPACWELDHHKHCPTAEVLVVGIRGLRRSRGWCLAIESPARYGELRSLLRRADIALPPPEELVTVVVPPAPCLATSRSGSREQPGPRSRTRTG